MENSRRISPGSLRVAAIGGGTGLPMVLEGLKRTLFSADGKGSTIDRDRLTAVVTSTDDGGSSGRLRRAYGVLPPGDVRNCLLALSDHGVMSTLFRFRFGGPGDVAGHSLGNLILTALSLSGGSFAQAVEQASQILSARGRVVPATLTDVVLRAELEDGSTARGETAIVRAPAGVRSLTLEPAHARLSPAARDALRSADLVVIGPGSLYTSLVSPLLVRGLPEAVAASGARVVLVMNVMTERGESDGLTASQHLGVVLRHAPQLPIHDVLLNTVPVNPEMLARYAAEGAGPVVSDTQAVEALGSRPVLRGLLADSPKVRHDPRALAAALIELAAAARNGLGVPRAARG